ncbi:Hypothetical predicted protein [Prunus dulcis]|uniref:Uncharacterized protein n=1 Tax=Prunus dulcis TaxID=3755 RepID=A0A5E4FIY4_PRUDU|nr:Hypothetical predicted protein [Prunus dulcis]
MAPEAFAQLLLINGGNEGKNGNIFSKQIWSIAWKALQQAGPTTNLPVEIEKRGNAGGGGTCARPVAAHAAISSSENIASTFLDMVIGKPGTLTFALYQKKVS